MKIYTKTGDLGTTSLLGGKRVNKSDLRLEAYGTIDELNAFIGLLRSQKIDKQSIETLIVIQNNLFAIGASLATDNENNEFNLYKISQQDIDKIENEIDHIDEQLPKITNFVLPGGHPTVAYAHICRTICRRAERRIVELAKNTPIEKNIIIYINRTSDYFFVLSRKLTKYLEL